ncbi:MAG TPA: isoleucine--tRNA ligase, partial [Thiomicrospira sp.]|nr:isoleucine--tRNA ligase [Thiomicrospira sp.]
QLELLRKEGTIKGSLTAEVTLFAEDNLLAKLNLLADELRFVLITSYAKVLPLKEKTNDAIQSEIEGLHIQATASDKTKCSRCWHHREEVGTNSEDEELCNRCVENIHGDGEKRNFA